MTSVVSEAERLENLVTDLLTFAKPRKPELSSFDLNRMISDLKQMLQPQLFGKEIGLKLNLSRDEFWVYSDENGLRQVLLNVILNAVEASVPGGMIRVSLRQTQDRNIIYVEDTGEGFGRVDPEDLFEPYTTSKVKGSGLGLPISRRIMIGLRGTIELSKRKGRGTRCTIAFPKTPAAD
jgi:two-component system sensor histidine kinase HydH